MKSHQLAFSSFQGKRMGCRQDTMSQHDYYRKGLHVFFPKKTFFIQMSFGTIFLQFVVINAYNCPNT
jgi:hypothetical protein